MPSAYTRPVSLEAMSRSVACATRETVCPLSVGFAFAMGLGRNH